MFSYRLMDHMPKNVVLETCERIERQTDRQTADMLIAIIRIGTRGKVIKFIWIAEWLSLGRVLCLSFFRAF